MIETTCLMEAPPMAELAAGAMKIDIKRCAPEAAVLQLLGHVGLLEASDLFFTSHPQHVAVLMRHLGIVRPVATLPLELGRRCIAHIKTRAEMDVSEKRRPLDGRWVCELESDHVLDLRISAIPTLHGEDLALRLLRRDAKLFVLENLGMSNGQLEQYRSMIDSPSGLILITGPTGSGKTSTLYASLIHLNDGQRKINTIEDPVEYALDGLRQSQVNPAIDLGFADLLRSVLRQGPDVIMIGEIRDQETAQTAVQAANSGMLVLATLHAPAAPAAVHSLRSLGAHPHFLASCLRGIVSQRLVRTLCPQCRISFDLTDAPQTFAEVRPWLADEQGYALHAPHGCSACNMTGYASRSGVFEVLSINSVLRDLIAAGRPATELRDAAREQKMLDFRQAALLKVAQGITSTEEVFRVVPTEHLMLED